MVPDEHGRVVGVALQSGDLAQRPVARLGGPGHVTRPLVQLVEDHIAHGGVAVGDDHVSGATGKSTFDGRIHVAREPAPRPLVVLTARQQVVAVADAGDAFHINREKDSHA